jgi:hypothetical protein
VASLRPLAGLCLGALLLLAPEAAARGHRKRAARHAAPPIAFYLADGVKGPSADEAIDACLAHHTALHQKFPEIKVDPERCQPSLQAVHGPFVRKKKAKKGERGDPSVHVYKGRDGIWRDEAGEAAPPP